MAMNNLVSIITPSYNTAEFIAETIESVLAQTYANWEMIIVDDCSTDNTDKVLEPFLEDSRIRFIKNARNSGAAFSRNRALREAKGKWIAFLDSDDVWLPDKLEKQIAFMERHNIHFSYTCYQEIDENSALRNITVSGPRKVTKRGIYNYCWMGCLTVMYDLEYVGLIQIEEIRKNNDYAIWLQVCKKTECYLLDEVLAKYRRGRTGSISTHNYATLIKWHYKLFRICENKGRISALMYTCGNLFFGVIKKLKYVKES